MTEGDSLIGVMIACVALAVILLIVALVLVCVIIAKKKNKDVSKVKMEEDDLNNVKTQRPEGIKVKNPDMWDDDFGKKKSKNKDFGEKVSRLGDCELAEM